MDFGKLLCHILLPNFLINSFVLIKIKFFLYRVLGNVTGAIVNVDEYKVHENKDGSVDKTKTDLYLHLVNQRDNSIMEVNDVLQLVDQKIEHLDGLFKVSNLLLRF